MVGKLRKLEKLFSEDMDNDEKPLSYGKHYSQYRNRFEAVGDYLLTNKWIYCTLGYKIRIDNINEINWGSPLNGKPGTLVNLKREMRKYVLSIELPKGNFIRFKGKVSGGGGWTYIVSDKNFIDDVIRQLQK